MSMSVALGFGESSNVVRTSDRRDSGGSVVSNAVYYPIKGIEGYEMARGMNFRKIGSNYSIPVKFYTRPTEKGYINGVVFCVDGKRKVFDTAKLKAIKPKNDNK